MFIYIGHYSYVLRYLHVRVFQSRYFGSIGSPIPCFYFRINFKFPTDETQPTQPFLRSFSFCCRLFRIPPQYHERSFIYSRTSTTHSFVPPLHMSILTLNLRIYRSSNLLGGFSTLTLN